MSTPPAPVRGRPRAHRCDGVAADARRILDTGLRDLWHPVAPSRQVEREPVGLSRLGEPLVLWRDAGGRVHALEDRCPHRGARLSLGWNLGERLACRYHGVEVDRRGIVTAVPAEPDCPMRGTRQLRSYPVREAAGAVFVWFGLDPDAPPAPLRLPEELTSDAHARFLCVANWRTGYRYALDNFMDPAHGAFLHAVSHALGQGARRADTTLRATPTGLRFDRHHGHGGHFDWVEFGDTHCLWVRLGLPYKRRYGPGGDFGIVGFFTGIDPQHCQAYFWRTRKVQGWQRDVWRFLYRNRLEALHWAVLEQDRLVLENMPEHAREREFPCRSDGALLRVRRLLLRRARTQACARARQGMLQTPPATLA